jgi:hypothetical protein
VKIILTAALALAALTSAALADEAVELTDAQMDKVTAGVGGNHGLLQSDRTGNPAVSTAFIRSDQRQTDDPAAARRLAASGGARLVLVMTVNPVVRTPDAPVFGTDT